MDPVPSCWVPPDRLPDLPPGEAVRTQGWEVYGARARFPPSSAPGFSRALAMGLLPAPLTGPPPAPLPGLPAWHRLLLALGAVLLGVPALLVLGPAAGADEDALAVPVLLLVAAAVVLFLSFVRRQPLEHAAGYTSAPDAAGLWRLARDGRVLREPDRTVPPPGWYPSPYYPGILQRWEGPGWAPLPEQWWDHEEQWFRRPVTPFL